MQRILFFRLLFFSLTLCSSFVVAQTPELNNKVSTIKDTLKTSEILVQLEILEKKLESLNKDYEMQKSQTQNLLKRWESSRKYISSLTKILNEIKSADTNRVNKCSFSKFYSREFLNYERILLSTKLSMLKTDSNNIVANLDLAETNLGFIKNDLFSKVEKNRYSGLSEDCLLMIDKVSVEVRAVDDNGNTIAGCNVEARPEITTSNSLIEVFNPTNNAKKKLKPGTYIFTIQKGAKRAQRVENIEFGEDRLIIIQLY